MNGAETENILAVNHLKKYFDVGKNEVLKAVDDVSFNICKGETFGVVGESGCGKTTLARTIVNLYQPTAGSVMFEGKEISNIRDPHKKFELTKHMQMIFQDPYASLNPRAKVMDIIGEGLDAHHLCNTREERTQRILDLLKLVGLDESHAMRFPHEFSGGQRQRIGIARALAVDPTFIVCDEPISALDVSIQAQVVNLLEDLQQQKGITYLFIAHDLSMVRHISDRIGVMYLGTMMEVAESEELFENPVHPYTKALLSAAPVPDPDEESKRKRIILEGTPSSPINLPPCCTFCERCSLCKDICRHQKPVMREISKGHFAACHRIGE